MNWTGGTLQRTKHANKGVVLKQKAYFARARTHLQNGTKSPDFPFRPSYLQADDSFKLAGRLPSFGSRSVRRTGHSVRQQRDAIHREETSGGKQCEASLSSEVDTTSALPAASCRVNPQVLPPLYASRDERPHKRKVVDSDVEVQLLQANKKRLLQQRDWIGVALSRPVNLCRLPSEEKRRHGKRRNVEGQHGAIARRGGHADPTMPRLQPKDDHYANTLTADALTTACSTHPENHEQSQASSDPMLFDQQNSDVGLQYYRRAAQLTPIHIRQTDSTYEDYRHATPSKQAQSRDSVKSYDGPARRQSERRDYHKQAQYRSGTEHAAPMLIERGLSAQDTFPKIRISQRVDCNKHPLRLMFEHSTSPALGRDGDELQRCNSPGSEHAIEKNDTAARHRRAMHLGSVPDLSSRSEARATNAIVDEQPWALLLDVPDQSSSRPTSSDNSRMSVVHDHPTVRTREAESTKWSQCATKGNHPSSSVISASLPALNRHTPSWIKAPAHAVKKGLDRCNDPSMQTHDGGEQMWHNFIFSSDEESSSEVMRQHGDDSERLWQGSSGYLPLSVAVSSIISSTPFRPISGGASREEVHDDAELAPAAGSWTVNAPNAVFAHSFETLSEHEQIRLAKHSAFGEYSVTHASILNNASCDTASMSSRMLSLAETSRGGLDQSQRATDTMSQQAPASSNEAMQYFRPSSQYESPGSFDEGLDLIDADAF